MIDKTVYRLMAYLFFIHSTMTIINGYIPVFFKEGGLTGSQVGVLMAIGPLATILGQPMWGYLSDKYKSIKKMILIALIGVTLTIITFIFVHSFVGYLMIIFLLFFFISPTTALGDSLSQKTAMQQKISFGRIRLWGSLGFAITSLIVGYVLTVIGIENIMYPMLLMAVIAFLVALTIKDVPGVSRPVTIIDAVKLVANPPLMLFFFLLLFISVSHRANDIYLGLYIVDLGGPEAMIGWAWFIGVMAEAIVFATSAIWFRKWSPLSFIVLAGGIYLVRWLLMAFVTNPWFIMPIQITHGLTFGVLYLAAFQYVNKLIPEHLQATGHVLFITIIFGVAGIIGSLLGGTIIELTSISNLYFILSISATIGTVGLLIFKLKKD
ncbi:MFS transporter [Halalkalibacter akibai]|uniref:Permeases of the major facilitator superfamily n=1 Tax=Halalkalibacter akibai (strain ATCC 43226 / DSM 21942 / CIP 109018 / JCM 9157 / 1139) TaxID=1236973 RepID=W4QWP6_HALA3|nr:MFS transporter [Halalkalibacter akibai]GAE35749.1 permeases of the major facilitator superfamily [Halalkalibacter akibai JCM 9157]